MQHSLKILLGGIIIFGVGYYSHSLVAPHSHTKDHGDMNDMSLDMSGKEMGMEMNMNPDPIEINTDAPRPSISIAEVIGPDAMGAYAVRVALENYTITPEKIDEEPIDNEGHMHAYVDGVKVGREYAEWVYLPAQYFEDEGSHRITVSLNANTHGAWVFADTPIEATVQVP